MFSTQDFDAAIAGALAKLCSIRSELKIIKCPEITFIGFKLTDLSQGSIERDIKLVPTGYRKDDKGVDYIYIIKVSEEQCDVLEKLRK